MSEAQAVPAVAIRPATAADRAFVLQLAARLGPTRAAWRDEEEVVCGTRVVLARAFDRPLAGEAVLIALDAGSPAGFAFLVTQHDFFTGEAHGHVSELASVADGRGIGSALLTAAEDWSRERGFRYLSLNVNDANAAGRRFYAARAYVPEYRHLVKLLSP